MSRITRWLERAPAPLFIAYAALASFATYFCMHGFRKPFAALPYEGLSLWGLSLKTLLVTSQIVGYGLAKYVGVKVCSELPASRRLRMLLGLVLWAEAMLLLFALLPLPLKPIALVSNGLSLGMVWGVCILYIEGRRATELIFAGLCTSYIVASGVVKDVGRTLMDRLGIDPFWMPAATGLVFLLPFAAAAFLLDRLPAPSGADMGARTPRAPMGAAERRAFIACFAPGVVAQLSVYVAITAFRDFRDGYGIEIWKGLGLETVPAVFTRSETWVGLSALLALVGLRLFDSRRWGVAPNLCIMILGMTVIGGSTWLRDGGAIGGFAWMVLTGVGAFLGYVACDTIFYERVIASTGWVGTAVFMAHVMDAGAYTGSVGLQLSYDLAAGGLTHLEFFRRFCYALSIGGTCVLVFSLAYFRWKARRVTGVGSGGRGPADPGKGARDRAPPG